jgi:ABC-2 type transport system ATP-binding protein
MAITNQRPIIDVRGVHKSFGSTHALAGVDLQVEAGTVVGLLGPNGAGKTTLVRILATLSSADEGSAYVDGIDVGVDPTAVRRSIGLAGQFAAVDEILTGRENLEMVGRLYGLSRRDAQTAAVDALERLGLTDAGDRLVKTYSGGMRRRLDLGASLVFAPKVLILDEPTTGLDPRTRIDLWDFIRSLVAKGTTVLLTTQYLEEADELADRIIVIDHGSVIAEGTSMELKDRLGGDVVRVTAAKATDVPAISAALEGLGSSTPTIDAQTSSVSVPAARGGATEVLIDVVRRLDAAHITVSDLGIRRPSLDDVFLALTGRAATTEDPSTSPTGGLSKRAQRRASRAGGGQ